MAAIYGLHRLALRLEARGHLYYLNRKPKGGSPMGSLVAFQQAIEPRVEHVLHVSRINHLAGDEAVPGPGPEPGPGKDDPDAERPHSA
jgi:hypothetical protein